MFVKTLNVTTYDTTTLVDKSGNKAVVRLTEAEEWCKQGWRRLSPAEAEGTSSSNKSSGQGGDSTPATPAAPAVAAEPDVGSMTTKELVEFCRSESLGLDVSTFSAMDEKRKAVLAAWRNKHRG